MREKIIEKNCDNPKKEKRLGKDGHRRDTYQRFCEHAEHRECLVLFLDVFLLRLRPGDPLGLHVLKVMLV